MICPTCGTEVGTDMFCSNCGTRMPSVSSSAASAPNPGPSFSSGSDFGRSAAPSYDAAGNTSPSAPSYPTGGGYTPSSGPAYASSTGAYTPPAAPTYNTYVNVTPESLPPEYRPLSAWAYFGLGILFSVPIVGFVFLIVFSFNRSNLNRRSFARSYFCWLIIIAVVVLILALTGGLTAVVDNLRYR